MAKQQHEGYPHGKSQRQNQRMRDSSWIKTQVDKAKDPNATKKKMGGK